jgi:hypothetical protein
MVVGDKKFGALSNVIVGESGAFSPRKCLYYCTPYIGLHYVRFLKQIFGYTALHYTVDRPNLQLSTCMVCLCKYHNSVTNLFGLAFQQLKSIGSGICYPFGNF